MTVIAAVSCTIPGSTEKYQNNHAVSEKNASSLNLLEHEKDRLHQVIDSPCLGSKRSPQRKPGHERNCLLYSALYNVGEQQYGFLRWRNCLDKETVQ